MHPQSSFPENTPLALVIGCGDMGMSCARALGRGTPLFIVDIDADRLAQSHARLEQEGYIVFSRPCDITDAGQVEELGLTLAECRRGVRVLAHVAAIANSPLGWRYVLTVDLIGAHRIAGMVGQHMVRGGAAILISSTGSYQCPANARLDAALDSPFDVDFFESVVDALGGEPDLLQAYFVAKQGLNRLAVRLALEWGPRQVRALSVSPGLIDSTMGRTGGAALPVYDGGAQYSIGSRHEKAAKEVPLGRQGTLLEVSSVVAFLASEAASFVNGIDVPIDGGSTALRRARGLISR